jgi:hypothetical protein
MRSGVKHFKNLSNLLILLITASANAEDSKCNNLGSKLINLSFEMSQEFKKIKSAAPVQAKYNPKLDQIFSEMETVVNRHPECQRGFEAAASEARLLLRDIKDANCGNVTKELLALTVEMTEEFEKTKSSASVMAKYKGKFDQKTMEMQALGEKHPECQGGYKAALDLATKEVKDIYPQNKVTSPQLQTVSYDEWFTLQSTGIKSGKKYSFIACVNGSRNVTAVQCHTSGSAAKRIFYNTDDMKDIEAKKKWVNTINEKRCVTAYVTGGEAFIVDIRDQNECK